MIHLKGIYIYPVKGMAGVSVDGAIVQRAGLEQDRRFMIIDDNGDFISQRTVERLALCKVSLSDQDLTLRLGGSEVHVDPRARYGPAFTVRVWNDAAVVRAVSGAVDRWLDLHVAKGARLVALEDEQSRLHKIAGGPASTYVSLADGYPVLIAGTASLALLNSKLEQDIKMDRFRPNIVVETKIAHQEDTWKTFQIGAAVFQHAKQCVRCKVVTVDQQDGTISKEPLRTLATYRKAGQGVTFGSNLIVQKEGVISVGDRVEILE